MYDQLGTDAVLSKAHHLLDNSCSLRRGTHRASECAVLGKHPNICVRSTLLFVSAMEDWVAPCFCG